MKPAVRSARGEKAELSSYAVALDIRQLHRGMMVARPAPRKQLPGCQESVLPEVKSDCQAARNSDWPRGRLAA